MEKHLPKPSYPVFEAIGKLIVREPKKIRSLLKRYGIKYPENRSEKKTINALLFAIKTKGKTFHHSLAKLLSTEKEDAFNIENLTGNTGGVTIGADPVSAIAGAVGSIANVIGNGQKKKQLEQQARSQLFASLLSYKQSQRQEAANQINQRIQAQINQRNAQQEEAKNKKRMLGAGAALIVVMIGVVAYKKRNQ